jgi:phosphoribosylformylglycinamidine synthase
MAPEGINPYAYWFGEDQARYVITVASGDKAQVIREAELAGVSLAKVGVTGGDKLNIPGERPLVVDALRERNEAWLPIYMGAGLM